MAGVDRNKKVSRWYFGGLASAGAACCTHPLDLLKVMLQTQQEGKVSALKLAVTISKEQGVGALYNGLSASLCRQLTYSTVRFGIYEVGKQGLSSANGGAENLSFQSKVLLASAAGAAGGFVGTPADMINVRMQNDIKLPAESRRNYKHAIDGFIRVWKEEGFRRLFSGVEMATSRAVLMTVGQLSFYDQVKQFLISTPYFSDNPTTHFLSSLTAGAVATSLTQPLDVLKTRAMNAKPGEYKNLWHLVTYTAKLGPLGFFKGYVPAFVRLAPHTILTFLFMEQLRLNFGFYKTSKD
ncbi:mitochondrial dicarboxylate carrier [Bemisia tabaci]|nr:PREDICTED: mitochondrial dicarboxylate carrier [Bemisia tabaci]